MSDEELDDACANISEDNDENIEMRKEFVKNRKKVRSESKREILRRSELNNTIRTNYNKFKSTEGQKKKIAKFWNWRNSLIIVFIFALLFLCFWIFINNVNEFSLLKTNKTNQLKHVRRNLRNLMSVYKNQEDNLWHNIMHGIQLNVENPTKPSIIVLLANKNHPLNCIIASLRDISKDTLSIDSIILTPGDFDTDVGSVLTSMQSKIKNKAIIVWDLLNINVEGLKAFHNLCDTINPLEKEVIFIISIIAENYDNKIKPLEFVEKELWKKLNGKVKHDIIQPLITRITDGSISLIKSESSALDCPLSIYPEKKKL